MAQTAIKISMRQAALSAGAPSARVRLLRRILASPPAAWGAIVIVLMLVTAVFAPFIAPYPYDRQNLDWIEKPPSPAHWFGTDALGRDMFSRIVWGAR